MRRTESSSKLWRRQKFVRTLLGKHGKVLTWTKIHAPIALVELENGERITGEVVDYQNEDIKTGMKVQVVLRRLRSNSDDDVIPYGLKFKPLKK